MTLHEELIPLATEASNALNRSRALLEAKLQMLDGELVWQDQPDKGRPYLGSYGASCSAIALLALGARQEETLVQQLIESVCRNQSEGGGWTIRNARPVNLTTACAFALIALGECGAKSEREQNAIALGADWLVRNLTPEGWPLYEGGSEVSCIATALAVRALYSVSPFVGPAAADALRQGCIALEKSVLEDGCWANCGIRDSGSAAATSQAIVTLIKTGEHAIFSEPVTRGLSWIRSHSIENLLVHDSADSFYVHMDDGGTAGVIYVHFTPALVVQSLLACEADLASDLTVKSLVQHLIQGQEENGEWRSPVAPRLTPSWMLMDGALALSQFIKAVSDIRTSLAFRDELAVIRTEMKDSVAEVNSRVADIDRILNSQSAQLTTLGTISHSHTERLRVLQPTLTFIRRSLPLFLLLIVLVSYVLLRPYIKSQAWVDIVAIATAVILAAIGIVATRGKSEKASTEVPLPLSDQGQRSLLPEATERVELRNSKSATTEMEAVDVKRTGK